MRAGHNVSWERGETVRVMQCGEITFYKNLYVVEDTISDIAVNNRWWWQEQMANPKWEL